jgi:hypothetical protein
VTGITQVVSSGHDGFEIIVIVVMMAITQGCAVRLAATAPDCCFSVKCRRTRDFRRKRHSESRAPAGHAIYSDFPPAGGSC